MSDQAPLVSRRELLGPAALSATALAIGCGGNSSSSLPLGGYDVIVVGAGIGGMSAAQALKASGKRVLVLEARGRVGGRAFSNNTFPAPFDYGAQYFDMVRANPGGGTENPLYDIAISRGVRTAPEGTSAFFMVDGVPLVAESQTAAEDLFLLDASIRQAGQAAQGGGADISASDACAGIADRPLFSLAEAIMVNQRGFLDQISSLDYWNQAQLMDGAIGAPSTETFYVPDGLGNFVASFADGLDISLNTPVTEIDYRGKNTVKVVTAAGSATARHVVIAVPLSILAKEKIRFKPGLPSAKASGLSKVIMQTVDKIGVEFSADVFDGIDDNTLVGEYVENSTASASIITKLMGKNQASIVIGGQKALDIEAAGMAGIDAYARETISKVFGADTAAKIVKTACNPWHSDPWAMGSWSIALPGGAPARIDLASPIDDRIYFVGEAYTPQKYGLTHGAYITGQTAAAQIMAQV